MSYKRREAGVSPLADLRVAAPDQPALEHCMCLPLSSLHVVPAVNQEEEGGDDEKLVPATHELNSRIRERLSTYFPRTTPLSLLLLHISQREHIHILPQSAILQKRQRYHAPSSFLEQVLVNVHRAIRSSDQLLMHDGVGVAIVFPEVDQLGIATIVERVYNSVSLLQAETVIPPLECETNIVIGIGSYANSEGSLERLLYQTSVTIKKLTLRPAITTQLWNKQVEQVEAVTREVEETVSISPTLGGYGAGHVPFMELPGQLPTRLKQLIPHHVALELCCAPVGRDHHYLTVAMADPMNGDALRCLRELTGLTIFPVACEISELQALLANKW